MAQETLDRITTSSGSRKRWTLSAWVKLTDSDGDTHGVIYAVEGSSDTERLAIGLYNEYFYLWGTNTNFIRTNKHFTDFSAWTHVCVAVDTTSSHDHNRIKLWINGELTSNDLHTDDRSSIPGDSDLGVNRKSARHSIGRDVGANAYHLSGNLYDLYLVDGSCLTPDVFAKNKSGTGSQNHGNPKSTSHQNGQWVPILPSVVKSKINSEGGFGVNGFYLPLNDRKFAGADFHCDPLTIFKLDGEDEPQPRCGASVTLSNYMSRLREDPFKDNLVLAIPGNKLNLVNNGTFDSNANGWVGYNAVVSAVDGKLKVDDSANAGGWSSAVYEVSVVSGQSYVLEVDVLEGTDDRLVGIYQGEYPGGATGPQTTIGTYSEETHVSHEFTATSDTVSIILVANNNGVVYYDNVVLYAKTPKDYSADIKGSGTNKTTSTAGAGGIGVFDGVYSSGMRFDAGSNKNRVIVSSDEDFNLGGNDFTIECWVYPDRTTSTESLITTFNGVQTNNGIWFGTAASGNIGFYWYWTDVNGTGNSANVTSPNTTLHAGQLHHVCAERYQGVVTLYVNGVPQSVMVGGNAEESINSSNMPLVLGGDVMGSSTYPFDGKLTDVRFYNGVAKYKGGYDVPKHYNPEGFSSVSEEWRSNNDNFTDNFAINNINDKTNAGGTLSNGNLLFSGGSGNHGVSGTIPFMSGKWYVELLANNAPSINSYFGIMDTSNSGVAFSFTGSVYYYQYNTGNKYGGDGSFTETSYGSSVGQGDIIGMAVDMDNEKIFFSKNGVWQNSGNPVTGANPAFTIDTNKGPYYVWQNTNASHIRTINFGQNPTFCGQKTYGGIQIDDSGKGQFKYKPPTGFLALCASNLNTPIKDPGDHFKTVLYNGDGNNSRSVDGVGFQPDLVWLKERTNSSSHQWHDSVRGPGYILMSNSTEGHSYSSTYLNTFDSDGFTVGSSGGVNQVGQDYVAWCWKAGGPLVKNTDGSITTNVSANPTAGFSIVQGTQTSGTTTFGHGLGKAPDFIITKQTNGTTGWYIYHKSLGSSYALRLDNTSGRTSFPHWVTNPTPSVFSMGSGFGASENYVAYCWHDVEGFSKFGHYIGNGNASGTFINCGFRPAWVMIKRSHDSGGTAQVDSWAIFDSARDPDNDVATLLRGESSNTDASMHSLVSNPFGQFYSNGFKIANTSTIDNISGDTYVYAAFAEAPFSTANSK